MGLGSTLGLVCDNCVLEDDHQSALLKPLCLHVEDQWPVQGSSAFRYRMGDYSSLAFFLLDADWTSIFASDDVDVCGARLTTVFQEAVSKFIPKSGAKKQSRLPVWFSGELHACIMKKKRYHLKFKCTLRPQLYTEFSTLRKTVKRLIDSDQILFFDKMARNLRRDPQSFWKLVSPRYREGFFDLSLMDGGELASDPERLCSLFLDKFFPQLDVGLLPLLKRICIFRPWMRRATRCSYLQTLSAPRIDWSQRLPADWTVSLRFS